MESVVEQAAFGLLEYGAIGIVCLILFVTLWKLFQSGAKERAATEERDEKRENALRETVAKAFDQWQLLAIKITTRLARIEAKLKMPERDED